MPNEKPSTRQKSPAATTGSSSSDASRFPRTISATGTSSTSITANVTACTAATDAGIVSRGKRTLRMSGAFTTSDGAADKSAWEKNTQTTSPEIRKIG